jgi:hypothetical protein
MGEQYFCIRYADTKIRPAGLSAAIPRICQVAWATSPMQILRDFRFNPGCMDEQRFCESKIATSPLRGFRALVSVGL